MYTLTHSDATQAWSLMARKTSRNLILEVSVWPWYILGYPSGPSQQSTGKYRIIYTTCIKQATLNIHNPRIFILDIVGPITPGCADKLNSEPACFEHCIVNVHVCQNQVQWWFFFTFLFMTIKSNTYIQYTYNPFGGHGRTPLQTTR